MKRRGTRRSLKTIFRNFGSWELRPSKAACPMPMQLRKHLDGVRFLIAGASSPTIKSKRRSQEPYIVKLADFLSFSEQDNVVATCGTEQEAWQAIPRIRAEAEQRLAQFNREEMERRKSERRRDLMNSRLQGVAMIVGAVGVIWLLITVVRWFWQHPLFR